MRVPRLCALVTKTGRDGRGRLPLDGREKYNIIVLWLL